MADYSFSNEDEAMAWIESALDQGINHFDFGNLTKDIDGVYKKAFNKFGRKNFLVAAELSLESDHFEKDA